MTPPIQFSQTPTDSRCIRVANGHVYLLSVEADDGQTYGLPTAHLESVVLGPVPDSTAGQSMLEKAVLRFTSFEVEVRGRGLSRLLERLATNTLQGLRHVPPRHSPIVSEVPLVESIRVRTRHEP